MFLNPACAQWMKTDAADGGKYEKEYGTLTEEQVDNEVDRKIDNPIGNNPAGFLRIGNAVCVKHGSQRLDNEEECKPDGFSQRRVTDKVSLPFERNVGVFVNTIKFYMM